MRPLTKVILRWAAFLVAVAWVVGVLMVSAMAQEHEHDWIITKHPRCCDQVTHCRHVILHPLGWGYAFEHPFISGQSVVVNSSEVKPSDDLNSWACYAGRRNEIQPTCVFKAPVGM
jgi:hypothetical protein